MVTVGETLAMAHDASASPAARVVGREHELETLRDLVEKPLPGALIVITGEAGIGKSTLVNVVVAERLAIGDRVLRGAADEHGSAQFSLWRRAMRELGVTAPHADPSVGAADHVDEVAATIGDSLAGGAWRVVVLEDAQWADASSLAVLRRLVDRLIGHEVAFVVTVRPGEPRAEELRALRRQAQPIVLGGLTPEQIEAFALQRNGAVLTRDDAVVLHRRTGGNPLFVGELLAAGTPRLPSSSGGLLTDAIVGLGATTADVLGVMAIAGRSAPVEAIAHASSMSVDDVETHRRRGLDANVLVVDADGWWFRHDLLAEAAGDRLDHAARRAVHRSLAEFWSLFPMLDDGGLERAQNVLLSGQSAPGVDDVEVVVEIAAGLRAMRRAGDAAELLERAVRAWGAAPAELATRLWMALGEARWDLGERNAALACFERAADGIDAADLATAAAIEVARQRNHNPFMPDPDARRRLADLDRRLAGVDSAVRAALLGRRAVLALQPPADPDAASALADAAVAMARRLDDPDALLTGLCDRAFVVSAADDVRRRKAIADEILELARSSGRPDRALAGHEWRFDDCLSRGDLAGARRSLHELEALAIVAPSPFWGDSAALRRAQLLLAEGDGDGAVDAIAALAQAWDGRVERFEIIGVELAVRAPAMIVLGRRDPRVAELQSQMVAAFDAAPSPFMQVRLAVGDVLVGDRVAARRRASHWLREPGGAFEAPDPVGTLALMAFLSCELQMRDEAMSIAEVLGRFDGLFAEGMGLPVDLLLADLATLTGDTDEAVRRSLRALALARAMPSAVIEAHCLRALADAQLAAGDTDAATAAAATAAGLAERSAVVLTPPWSRRAAEPGACAPMATRQARLRREGDVWRVAAGHESAMLPHITGLSQLAMLVRAPGVEVSADDLNGSRPVAADDLGPALDARAKREYRQRINDLQADIDEAERWADGERAEIARSELDAIVAELRRAVGIGGRDRPHGSGSERARINVARNIRRAIAAIQRSAPELAAHLTVSVRTGHHCVYAPEPAARIEWDVGP
jgi:hypothetical protein